MTTFITKMFSQINRTAVAASTFALALSAVGCGEGDMMPDVVLIDRTTSALSYGALNALNGSYGGGCIGRTGSWSSPIGGFAGSLDNSLLSVVKGNSACVLTMTSMIVGTDRFDPNSSLALTDAYAATPKAFVMNGETETAFYGNLKLSDTTFTSSFQISLMFSEDASQLSAGNAQATYKFQTITSSQSQVPPPDYTVAGSSNVALNTDAAKLIEEVSGSINLTDGAVIGEMYVVSSAALGATPSFDAINDAYTAGTEVAVSANPSIAASSLQLVGSSLASGSIKRHVIVANIVEGVRAYQVVTITLLPPS